MSKILKFTVPNPYFEGKNNVYLISDKKPALIDTGIGTQAAFAALKDGLQKQGYSINDLAYIFITHKHPDHFGLAHSLQEISGAEVYVHEHDWKDVAYFEERQSEVVKRYKKMMIEWGIPEKTVGYLTAINEKIKTLARSPLRVQALKDNERFSLGGEEIITIHTPGHTKGSACFLYEDKLFTGDHLLPNYTPNIGATDISQALMLPKYIKSLLKIRKLDGLEIFPGHGEMISNYNYKARIDAIIAHHQERQEKIQAILADGTSRTVHEISLKLFGNLREHHIILGAGEVQAHLEVLQRAGQVEKIGNAYRRLFY